MKQHEATNALDSGLRQAAAALELHCEMIYFCERERRLRASQRPPYEPPAAPDFDPQHSSTAGSTRKPDNCSECEARAHFTEPAPGSFVHKGRHTECVGALVVVVAAVEMLGLFVWLVIEGLWAAVRGVWE